MTPFKGRNRVTSLYGRRTIRGVPQWHPGLDIVGNDDARVRAIWTAIKCVVSIGWNDGRGNMVTLYYSNTLRVICQHLSTVYVKTGQMVKQGKYIGLMGNTGDSLGAHLHIEVQQLTSGRWAAINPAGYVEVPNVPGTHNGNDNLDGGKVEPPYKPPANTAILTVGPVSGGDRKAFENEAARLALGCSVLKTNGNETTLLIGPASSGDQTTIMALAKKLLVPCKTWTGSIKLMIGPASAGDVIAVKNKAAEVGAVATEQDAAGGEKMVVVMAAPDQKQVLEALAAALALPVGVV